MNLLKQIRLPNGRFTLNLGFGGVGLLRIPLPPSRTRLLRTAVDLGITHFDVARMYGLGAAEGVIGAALYPFRDRLTYATKFGIPRPVPHPLVVNAKYAARWLVAQTPSLFRNYKRRASVHHTRHVDFSVDELERSLAVSLKQMQTEQIDLLFLHEPIAADNLSPALSKILERKVASGTIGAFGISGHLTDVDFFLGTRPELCQAIQYDYSLLQRDETQPLHGPQFTGMFRVLEGTLQPLAAYFVRDPELTSTWSDRLGLDLTNLENLGIVILAASLNLNPDVMVIFSTTRVARLRRIVGRLTTNSFTPETLCDFHTAIAGLNLSPHAD